MHFCKNSKKEKCICLLIQPSHFWNISKGNQNTNKKNISTPMFIAALFTITKIWKQSKCPSLDEWIKQLWNIYTMEFCLAIKKKKVLPFVTVWIDLEHISLRAISQLGKDKYHIVSLICGI